LFHFDAFTGGGMALLFAENGIHVLLNDPVDQSLFSADHGLSLLCFNYAIYFGDTVVSGLYEFLSPGDIIIDASNEHWENNPTAPGKARRARCLLR